jgi:molybdopterin synthase sulfur carrier subunit
MARVKVRMFATVREAAGTAEVELDASTLEGLLEELGRRFGRRMAKVLSGADGDYDRLVVLVNGRNVRRGRDEDTGLEDGDEVALFPPVSGG